ncbi:hypothetical protein U9M48_034024 [Paspalum notatum var. saurae]|uniref:GRF-type domain-containing protein n=1 Tax=Paspalum notatum var. saurae TaxID=547442 RepID=A0AAQ3U9Z0_PASNO
MGESSSSRASSSAARVGLGPPVPYREGALSYQPVVLCRCGLKAHRRISWSDDNPGRRYLRCSRCRTNLDCKFFDWIDCEHTPFLKNLLLELRNAVWELQKERAEMQQAFRREIDELKEHRQQLEVEDMCKAEELKAIEKKLTERDELLQALALNINAGNRSPSVSFVLLVFVVGVLVGMVVPSVVMG